MKDREKEIKYQMYLCKRAIIEEKKKLVNLKMELTRINNNLTKTRKLNNKRK